MIDGMEPRTRIVLIRHGRAEHTEGRCIGHTDVPLSAEGRAAIRSLSGHALSVVIGPASIIASDLRRAVDSAAILATALGAAVECDRRLREMDFGEWDGQTWTHLERNDGDRLRAWTDRWIDVSVPGGETARDLERRAADWLHSTRTPFDRTSTVFAVGHAGWIRAAVGLLLGRPLDQLFDTQIDHAHTTIVDRFRMSARLVAENVNEF